MNNISFHKRNLPHFYIPTSTYFITFRLKDSIHLNEIIKLHCKYEILKLKEEFNKTSLNDDLFYEYDNLLHSHKIDEYLSNNKIAETVKTELHKYDEKDYKLICYCIMPNHVHLIFHLLEKSRNVSKIMQAIKRVSAYYANLELGKKGSFWQAESFDHIVRNEEELEMKKS